MYYSIFQQIKFLFLIGVFLGCSGCITLVQDLHITPLNPHSTSLVESQPNLRVHTTTGGVLLFPEGAVVTPDSLFGRGHYYGLNLDEAEFVDVYSYPIDQVARMETISRETNPQKSVFPSIIGSVFATAGIGGGLLLIALSQASFGGGDYCVQ